MSGDGVDAAGSRGGARGAGLARETRAATLERRIGQSAKEM